VRRVVLNAHSEVDDAEPVAATRFRVHAAPNVVTDLARSRGSSVTEERTALARSLLSTVD
jgi:hypothetical protein